MKEKKSYADGQPAGWKTAMWMMLIIVIGIACWIMSLYYYFGGNQ